MEGTLGNGIAPLQGRRECDYRPYYLRSDSLQSLNAISSSTLASILVREVRVKQDRRNDENKCSDVSNDYENYFNATVLEKVNTEHRSPKIYPAGKKFYPALHRLLTERRNWGFRIILTQMYGGPFVNFGGPLTNTLHHGVGEDSISLYNLEWIGDLPILRVIYEEFLLPNKDLTGHNKYPTTVAELLCIHAELCRFHKVNHVYDDHWLDHFYGEYLVYCTYGEQTNSEQEKFETKKKSPLHISRQE
ncbi:hypothetical protein Cgig2_030697 [Carnegiea gigantea]|uniref:Uncharacterized protein n=1 Tax=Carnegiea gigantea TaxID=171969 RepID=A0A9Q1GZP5_9CARY|nr:hypothetical protein Cgig2_030697 [Carnegiea gigantea]